MKQNTLKISVAVASALFSLTSVWANPVLVGVSLGSANTSFNDSASVNGIYWNRTPSNSSSPSLANLIHAGTGLATGISFSTHNAGGFFRTADSLPAGPIDFEGVRFPTEVLVGGIADNFASPRDGLMVFRFVIPESLVTHNAFQINSVLGSNNSLNTFQMNIGGTWGGSADRTFTGGTTVSGGGSTTNHSFVTISDVGAVYDANAQTYTLDLQYGYTATGTSGVVAVRGMTIAVIPEPSTFALLTSLAAIGLVTYRRRWLQG